MYMSLRGSITVFISALMIVILTFSSAICESVRIRGAKISGMCALDAATESSMSKYDVRLMEEFEIFGSYFHGMGDYIQLLSEDIKRNLNPEKEFLMLGDTDFWKLDMNSISLNKYQLLTDNNGEAFFEQAVLHTKENVPVDIIELLTGYVNNNENPDNIEDYFENEEKKTDDLIEMYKEQADSDTENTSDNMYEYTGEIIEVEESPVEVVKTIKKEGVLSLVIPQDRSISAAKIDVSTCLSNRNINEGIVEEPEETTISDKALFVEYISGKLLDFTSTDNKSTSLNYKLEYCLGGKESDEANLKYAINRLLLIKEATNFAYLLTDGPKKSQAMAVAAGIAGVSGSEKLIEAVKYAILLAWAYGESIVDVRNLLNGGTSALLKTDETWRLEIANIGKLGESLTEPVKEANGLNYTSYLKLLMMFKNKDELVLNCMDMVEQVMRELYDKKSYCLDNLIANVEPVVTFISQPIFMNFKFMNNYIYSPVFKVDTKLSYI